MLSIGYRVTSVTRDKGTVEAVVAGRTVMAEVPVLCVECVSADGGMGHTYRFSDFTDDDEAQFIAARDAETEISIDFNFPA